MTTFNRVVRYYPQRFLIEPLGFHLLDPLMEHAEVEKYFLFQQQGGQGTVHLLVNGRNVDPAMPLGQAALGATLRAKFYGLRGGAWTLSAMSEAIQTLLVQHGCPATLAKNRSDLLYDQLGHGVMKKVLDDKHPWQVLKKEASTKTWNLYPQGTGLFLRGSALS